ncbi:MAG: regulatory protein RecX [Coriobacteriia bacterium]
MIATIERIESAGHDGRARRLFFSTSGCERTTSAAAVKVLNLKAEVEVDTERLETTLQELEPRLARERALVLLRQRERSSSETRQRLLDAGYPADVVQGVVDWLITTNLVSDERFALAWARTRQAAGYGRSRVARELALKGVPDELSATAIEEAYQEVRDVEEARRVIGNRPLSTPKERQREIRRLVGRGFSLAIALQATESASDNDWEACEDD